jgi:dipeptidase D
VEWKKGGAAGAPWEAADAERLIDGLLALPHGVLAMSRSIPGLVETSNNLGIVQTQGDEVVVTTLTRSSSNPALEARCGQIAAALRLAGARVEPQGGYPGWQPNLDSRLLRTASEVHARLFGHPPAVEAVHAGLECGVLGAKVPGLDMLSFGPTIEGAHTPKERIAIDTVAPFYRLLKDLLAEIAGAR